MLQNERTSKKTQANPVRSGVSADQPRIGEGNSWLTAEEAALYLRVHPRTVLLWVRQGKLKGYVLSGTKRHVWRFRVADLDDMMRLPSVAPRNRRIQ